MENSSIYTEFSPPKLLGVIGTAIGVLIFFIVASFSTSSMPFFAAMSVAVITMLVGLTWPLRHRKLLWVLIGLVAALHLCALALMPVPQKISYGLLFAPAIGIDIVVFWKLIVAVLKKSDQSG